MSRRWRKASVSLLAAMLLFLTILQTAMAEETADNNQSKDHLWGFVPVIGDAVNVPGYQHDDRGPSPQVLADIYKKSRANSIYVQTGVWKYTEPAAPVNGARNFDFTLHDAFVNPFISEGMNRSKTAIAYLTYGDEPQWVLDQYPQNSSEYWALADGYMKAIIERLNSRNIHYFIFENEPNMYGDNYLATYMERLKHAFNVAKSVNKDNKVIAANLSENAALPGGPLDRMYQMGLKDCSDIIGYHPYSDNAATGININDAARAHAMMEKYGDGDKKLFFGEGWGPKREVPGVQRKDPNTAPSSDEIEALRAFMYNGYHTLTTKTDTWNPDWFLGAFFFTMNDNWGKFHWAERAYKDQWGNWWIDGIWLGQNPNLSPEFYNGGLVDINGVPKGDLMEVFPYGLLQRGDVRPASGAITGDADSYELYINGQLIATKTAPWTDEKSFVLPLKPGKNIVAIKAQKPTWPRAVIFKMSTADQTWLSDSAAGWKATGTEQQGWNQLQFDDSAWHDAGIGLLEHQSPWIWGYESFRGSGAHWMWETFSENSSDTAYFRLVINVPEKIEQDQLAEH